MVNPQLSKTWTAIALLGLTSMTMSSAQATTVGAVDGQISAGEYHWDTTTAPNSKWYTRNGSGEMNDGSGGDNWDINYLGTDIKGDQFQVGAVGGSILGGSNTYGSTTLTLSDIAINVVNPADETVTDPALDSSGWDYALHLIGIDDSGNASFDLFSLGDNGFWKGSGKNATNPDGTYDHQDHSYGSTATFQMVNGEKLNTETIMGKYTPPPSGDADAAVLEVSFDLSLLSLFNEEIGGTIITYLTMSCANDEAIVDAQISAVPVPAAFWLFGTALIGFIGMSRRTQV